MVTEQPDSNGDQLAAEDAGTLLPFSSENPLMVGMPVVAIDGEVLGTVAEERDGLFKVAAMLAEDYWLPTDLIAGMAPGGDLVVSVDREGLDAAKLEAPDEG